MVSDVYHLLTHLACVAGAWNKERARAREGNTRVSLSRARSFLRPLLPSACYAGYTSSGIREQGPVPKRPISTNPKLKRFRFLNFTLLCIA